MIEKNQSFGGKAKDDRQEVVEWWYDAFRKVLEYQQFYEHQQWKRSYWHMVGVG